MLENREAGLLLKRQAVLFRTSSHSAALELELTRRNIPFVKFGGLKFLDAAHVKDVLACLRFAENPRDRIAGFRLLQLIPGIGPTIAGRLLDAVAEAADGRSAVAAFAPPAKAAGDWSPFAALYAGLDRASPWPAEIERVRGWYEPHLERLHDDATVRAADLVQLQRIAETYPSRQRFLTDLTLDPPDATSDEAGPPTRDEDYLILSTIHSAKGQEWNAVFLLNAVDGCIPSDLGTGTSDDIEEERRLLYVAMTRARDHLTLMLPQRFYVHNQRSGGDRHLYAARTRFIPECAAAALCPAHLAGRRRTTRPRAGRRPAPGRRWRAPARHVAVGVASAPQPPADVVELLERLVAHPHVAARRPVAYPHLEPEDVREPLLQRQRIRAFRLRRPPSPRLLSPVVARRAAPPRARSGRPRRSVSPPPRDPPSSPARGRARPTDPPVRT